MIDREYITVNGPPGAGKTTLIERLLESNRSLLLLAGRFREDPSIPGVKEEVGENDETLRYLIVGADGAFHCRFPPGGEGAAARWYWDTTWNRGFSDGVIVEGSVLSAHSTLTVFVLRSIPSDVPFVERRVKELLSIPFEEYVEAVFGPPPAGMEPGGPEAGGEEVWDDEMLEEEGEISVEIPDEVGRELLKWIEEGIPVRVEGWVLKDEFAGLDRAEIVVINAQADEDPREAERLASEIRRIWTDPEISRDLGPGWVTRRTPSIIVANLTDPRDEGSKKVVARMKRALRGR